MHNSRTNETLTVMQRMTIDKRGIQRFMPRFPFPRASLALSLGLRAYRTPVAFGTNAIVELANGRVVLVRHRYMPGLCFPGGSIAPGEPPADAVIRELTEEIGLDGFDALGLFGLYTRKVGW